MHWSGEIWELVCVCVWVGGCVGHSKHVRLIEIVSTWYTRRAESLSMAS